VTDTPTLAKLEAEVDRLFGLDAAEDRPFGHLTDEELEAELAKATADLGAYDAVLDELAALPGSVQGVWISGLPSPPPPAESERAHAAGEEAEIERLRARYRAERQRLQQERALEALSDQAMALFGLKGDLVTVPHEQVERWQAEAHSFAEEIQRTLAEEHEWEAAERAELAQEADRLWPMYAAQFGWEDA
jgi:hypothetical protein